MDDNVCPTCSAQAPRLQGPTSLGQTCAMRASPGTATARRSPKKGQYAHKSCGTAFGWDSGLERTAMYLWCFTKRLLPRHETASRPSLFVGGKASDTLMGTSTEICTTLGHSETERAGASKQTPHTSRGTPRVLPGGGGVWNPKFQKFVYQKK